MTENFSDKLFEQVHSKKGDLHAEVLTEARKSPEPDSDNSKKTKSIEVSKPDVSPKSGKSGKSRKSSIASTVPLSSTGLSSTVGKGAKPAKSAPVSAAKKGQVPATPSKPKKVPATPSKPKKVPATPSKPKKVPATISKPKNVSKKKVKMVFSEPVLADVLGPKGDAWKDPLWQRQWGKLQEMVKRPARRVKVTG